MKKIFLIAITTHALLIAGSIDGKFFYQDYLDFGSNKGKFQADKSVEIFSKDGNRSVKIERMPDFGAGNKTGILSGEFTNIGGSYIVTASHMITDGRGREAVKRGQYLEFGGVRSRIIGSYNDFSNYYGCSIIGNVSCLRDFEAMRMDKININQSAKLLKFNFFKEVTPTVEATVETKQNFIYLKNLSEILNDPRYSLYARSGTGIQGKNVGANTEVISNAGNYFTGGLSTNAKEKKTKFYDGLLETNAKTNSQKEYEDFSMSLASGDSGSALYIYDNIERQWLIIGVASTVSGVNCSTSYTTYRCHETSFSLVNNVLVNKYKTAHTEVLNQTDFVIRSDGFFAGSTKIAENLAGNLTLTKETRLKKLSESKDYFFEQSGTLTLQTNADLGASGLYFGENKNFAIKGNYDFIHAGLVVGAGSSVTYEAKTKAQDALVKMGEGKLIVSSSSLEGKLRIGEGEVELRGEQKSFGSIYAINGSKITINNGNQIDPKHLYFGINGAELELNGSTLDFENHINASDYGAIIKNTSQNKSTIKILDSIKGITTSIYHGQLIGNMDLNIQKRFIFDGKLKIRHLNATQDIHFQSHPLVHSYVSKDAQYYYPSGDATKVNSLEAIKENVYTSPTRLQDFQPRIFEVEQVSLTNASFSQGAYTEFHTTNLSADNSNLTIGSEKFFLDLYDGENVISTPCIGDDCDLYNTFDKEFQYRSSLQETQMQSKETYFYGDITLLNNSKAFINHAYYEGNIRSDATKTTAVFNHSYIQGSVKVENFESKASQFLLQVKNNNENVIISTGSASGGNNYLIVKPQEQIKKRVLLASLTNNQPLNEDYFLPKPYSQTFSIITPEIEFEQDGNRSNWYLASSFVEENKELTSKVHKALDYVSGKHILEWNNLFKRMGELRDEPSSAGLWVKIFGGSGSYLQSYKTGFAELQLGADKHNEYQDFELFAGGLLNFSYFNLSDGIQGKINGIGGGVYTSFIFNNGFFVDLIAKYLFYKNDLTFVLPDFSQRFEGRNNSFSVIASAEFGYRAKINENFYLEPQVELISGYLGRFSLENEVSKLLIKGTAPLSFKSSLVLGYQQDSFSIRGGVGSQFDLLKSAQKVVQDLNIKSVFNGKRDSIIFLNLGASYKIKDTSRLNLEIERSFLGDYNIDYLINFTFRQGF